MIFSDGFFGEMIVGEVWILIGMEMVFFIAL